MPVVLPLKARRGHPLTAAQEVFKRTGARYRIVVEPPRAQLNRFPVLRQVFRVVAQRVKRRLRVKPLKTYAA